MFDIMDIRGEIVIGEGIKDEAPGLFAGERVGRWREGTPRVDIAIGRYHGCLGAGNFNIWRRSLRRHWWGT